MSSWPACDAYWRGERNECMWENLLPQEYCDTSAVSFLSEKTLNAEKKKAKHASCAVCTEYWWNFKEDVQCFNAELYLNVYNIYILDMQTKCAWLRW